MIEADIIPLLKSVLPDKVFSYVVPQTKKVAAPWCILSLYDVHSDVVSGQAETMTNIHISVFSNTMEGARAIRQNMRQAISVLGISSITERQSYETDTKLFHAILECQVWQ